MSHVSVTEHITKPWNTFFPYVLAPLTPPNRTEKSGQMPQIPKMTVRTFVDALLSTPFRDMYRCVDQRHWFRHDDDSFWVFDRSNYLINNAIAGYSEYVGWTRGGNLYVIDQVRRLLAVHLETDRLPGPLKPSPSPAGPPSESPAPEDRLGQGQPYPPAPPVVPETAEPVDQADTGEPTGHTP